jgi:lysozyme family protein
VNSGIGRSGKVLRRVVGLPDNTHVVTDEVLRAVAKRDPKALVIAVNDERLAFLKRLKTWPVFGKGWSARVATVKSVSLRMAAQQVPSPSIVPNAAPVPGKGVVPPPAAAKKMIVGTSTAGSLGAGGGFSDWIVAHPWESAALGCGIAVIIGGSVYTLNRWHQRRQEAAIPDTPVVPALATV